MRCIFLNIMLLAVLYGNAQITASTLLGSPTCFGTSNGSIQISASGSNFPYDIYIINDQNDTVNNYPTSSIANFLYGDAYYYYTVVDANNNSLSDSVFLSQPDSIEFVTNIVQPNLPPDQGSIEVTNILNVTYSIFLDFMGSNGGNPSSNILASPGPVMYPNLDAGSYFIEVVDDNGCTNSIVVDIEYQSPIPPISFNLQVNQPFSTPGIGSIEIQNIQGNILAVNDLEIKVMDDNFISYPLTGLICENLDPANYSVTVTDTLTTMSHTETVILQFQDLSIDSEMLNDISISSQSKGVILISELKMQEVYEIFSSSGKILYSFNGAENKFSAELLPGLYVLSVIRNKKRMSRKFICK